MVQLTPKWDAFKTSIFSTMTQKAQSAGAVNLGQGFPDMDGPEEIRKAAISALEAGHNQYAPSAGLLELRQLLANRQKTRHGLTYNADDEVTVYSGATEALYCALQAFLDVGDEIVTFAPFYDSYPAAAHAAGARLVAVPLRAPDFRFDAAALASAIGPRTKALLINTPHNPTGRVFDAAELAAIGEVAVRHDLLVITDEVYEELVYAPHRHIPIATLPGMRERTITISSTSKTYSYTGWKIGYAFAPPAMTRAMRAVHQFTVFCSATPLQHAMCAALRLPESYYDAFRRDYQQRRDLLVATLRQAHFKVDAAQGTYFVLADYSHHSDVDDFTFADWLTQEVKVAAIPISGFYLQKDQTAAAPRYVRFAFCKNMQTLAAAAENFAKMPAFRRP